MEAESMMELLWISHHRQMETVPRSYIVENTETGEFLTTDPVNVGTYKATYSVAEGTNYQAGSISYEFAITEAR